MNCKPQELAIVVRTRCGNQVGKIVRCVRPIRFIFSDMEETDCWITEPMLTNGRREVPCPDSWLRPIRDPGDDARDETLLWKPTPKEGEISKEEADLLLEALRQWAKEQA